MTEIIPSRRTPDAWTALEHLVLNDTRIRAAVAFVTDAGVAQLRSLLAVRSGVTLEIVARAADVTSPNALLTLRDDLGAAVSVVIGRHATAFHPKLWLFETHGRITVLSGSGNLTVGGLTGNDEQFELCTLAGDDASVSAQEERFERLTRHAVSLDAVEGTAIWLEWLNVIKQQQRHRNELDRLGRNLAARDPVLDRATDKSALIEDLDEIYRNAVDAKLPTESGRPYVPSRFKQAINRARDGADPVRLVTQMCRHRTDGFDIFFVNDRPDLAVERLVLDAGKPYHDLFSAKTRELSAERMATFRSGRSEPPPGAPSSTRPSMRHVSQNVTAKDIAAGQVRIPIGPTKRLLPADASDLDVVLRGRHLASCRWDPRFGSDQERSGLIRVGTAAASELLTAGDILDVVVVGSTVHLD